MNEQEEERDAIQNLPITGSVTSDSADDGLRKKASVGANFAPPASNTFTSAPSGQRKTSNIDINIKKDLSAVKAKAAALEQKNKPPPVPVKSPTIKLHSRTPSSVESAPSHSKPPSFTQAPSSRVSNNNSSDPASLEPRPSHASRMSNVFQQLNKNENLMTQDPVLEDPEPSTAPPETKPAKLEISSSPKSPLLKLTEATPTSRVASVKKQLVAHAAASSDSSSEGPTPFHHQKMSSIVKQINSKGDLVNLSPKSGSPTSPENSSTPRKPGLPSEPSSQRSSQARPSGSANQAAPSLPSSKSPTSAKSNSPHNKQPSTMSQSSSPSATTAPKAFKIIKKEPSHAVSTSTDTTRTSPTPDHSKIMMGVMQEIGRKSPVKEETPLPKPRIISTLPDKTTTGVIKNLLNANLKTIVSNQRLVNETHERESSQKQSQMLSIRIEKSNREDAAVEIPVTSLESDTDEKDTVLIIKSDSPQKLSKKPSALSTTPISNTEAASLSDASPSNEAAKSKAKEKASKKGKKKKSDMPTMKAALRARDRGKYTCRYHCTHLTWKQKVIYSISGVLLLGALGAIGYYAYQGYLSFTKKTVPDSGNSKFPTTFGTGIAGFKDGSIADAQFNGPSAVAVDSQNNIYVADTENGAIRKISSAGQVSTISVSPTGTSRKKRGNEVTFKSPVGLMLIGSILYVSDQGDNTIKSIDITTNAMKLIAGSGASAGNDGPYKTASFFKPNGLSFRNTSILVVDQGNCRVRELKNVGIVSTYAGTGNSTKNTFVDGSPQTCSFNNPVGIAVDSKKNVFIADTLNNRIRVVNATTGQVSTFAGSSVSGLMDGQGAAAKFKSPSNLVIDSSDTLYVADSGNKAIRIISSDGAVVTSGGISGVIQNSEAANPQGLAISPSGKLIIADPVKNQIIQISVAPTTDTASIVSLAPVVIANPPANLINPVSSTSMDVSVTFSLEWVSIPSAANEFNIAGSPLKTIPALSISDNLGTRYSATKVILSIYSDRNCSIQSGASNVPNPSILTDSLGIANFTSFSITKTGLYYLRASASALEIASACSGILTNGVIINPGPASMIFFVVQPANLFVDNAIRGGLVLVTDDFGNPISNATLSLSTSSKSDCSDSSVNSVKLIGPDSVRSNSTGFADLSYLSFGSSGTVYIKVSSDASFGCSSDSITINVKTQSSSVSASSTSTGLKSSSSSASTKEDTATTLTTMEVASASTTSLKSTSPLYSTTFSNSASTGQSPEAFSSVASSSTTTKSSSLSLSTTTAYPASLSESISSSTASASNSFTSEVTTSYMVSSTSSTPEAGTTATALSTLATSTSAMTVATTTSNVKTASSSTIDSSIANSPTLSSSSTTSL